MAYSKVSEEKNANKLGIILLNQVLVHSTIQNPKLKEVENFENCQVSMHFFDFELR